MRLAIPVLVLSYNRVDTTNILLNRLKEIGVKDIYLYVDAPRNPQDESGCQDVRNLANEIKTWANISTYFPERNLGPRFGVTSAIDWFFSNVEKGIILEHDCIPNLEFFDFCEVMLRDYGDNERVMHISGMSPVNSKQKDNYYFIRIPLIWGWATWRRAWRLNRPNFEELDSFVKNKQIEHCVDGRRAQANWLHYFWATRALNIDSWDYAWTYSVMRNRGVCVTPTANLISNIGFGSEALHCTDTESRFSAMPYGTLPQDVWNNKHLLRRLTINQRVEEIINTEIFKWKTSKWILSLLGINKLIAESRSARNKIKKVTNLINKLKSYARHLI